MFVLEHLLLLLAEYIVFVWLSFSLYVGDCGCCVAPGGRLCLFLGIYGVR